MKRRDGAPEGECTDRKVHPTPKGVNNKSAFRRSVPLAFRGETDDASGANAPREREPLFEMRIRIVVPEGDPGLDPGEPIRDRSQQVENGPRSRRYPPRPGRQKSKREEPP